MARKISGGSKEGKKSGVRSQESEAGMVHPDYGELRAKRFHNGRQPDYWFISDSAGRLGFEYENQFESREACQEFIREICGPEDRSDQADRTDGTDLLRMIPLGLMHASPGNARKHFDQAGIEELAESIRQFGVIEPLVVRVTTAKGGGSPPHLDLYEVIAGERRFRAAWIAGLEEIPCIVRVEDDRQAKILGLIENVQRSDISAIEEAQAYQELVKDGMTLVEIARMVGKSEPVISNRLGLLKLPAKTQGLIQDGTISEAAGKVLKGVVDKPELLEELTEQALEPGVTSKQLETAAREARSPNQKDIDSCLTAALHGFANAEDRWAKRREAGLSDEDLKKAIGEEFGIQGWMSHPGCSMKGLSNPRLWVGSNDRGKPTLAGKALVDAVRRLKEIPYPSVATAAAELKTLPSAERPVQTDRDWHSLGKGDSVDARNADARARLAEIREKALALIDGELTNAKLKRLVAMAVMRTLICPSESYTGPWRTDAAKRLGITEPESWWASDLDALLAMPAETLIRWAAETFIRAELRECDPNGAGMGGRIPQRTLWLIGDGSNGADESNGMGLFHAELEPVAEVDSESQGGEADLDSRIEELAGAFDETIEQLLRRDWSDDDMAFRITPIGCEASVGRAMLQRIRRRAGKA